MPRNKYPERTVEKILDVSLKLFLEKGYEQTTIIDIVNNLGGMTSGAFYHHFKSKEDVFNVLMEKLFAEHNPFELVKGMEGASGLEKIRALMLSQMEENPNFGRYGALVQGAISLVENPRFLAEHMRESRLSAKMLAPLVEEGMGDGSIRPGDAYLMSELGMLLLNVWLIPTLFPCDKAEFARKIAIIRQIFDSLGAPMLDEKIMGKVESLADLLGLAPAAENPQSVESAS